MILYSGQKGTLLFTNIKPITHFYYVAHTGTMFQTDFVFRFSDWIKL